MAWLGITFSKREFRIKPAHSQKLAWHGCRLESQGEMLVLGCLQSSVPIYCPPEEALIVDVGRLLGLGLGGSGGEPLDGLGEDSAKEKRARDGMHVGLVRPARSIGHAVSSAQAAPRSADLVVLGVCSGRPGVGREKRAVKEEEEEERSLINRS